MNLPFILDIAIGLIFIYLILSLLASEIQEFLSTVFQWRAKHLKDSIENLLAGSNNEDIKEIVRVKKISKSTLYSSFDRQHQSRSKRIFCKHTALVDVENWRFISWDWYFKTSDWWFNYSSSI